MFSLFTYSDDELEPGARVFYGITMTRDAGTLKKGESYPLATVNLFSKWPILRIFKGTDAGAEIVEFRAVAYPTTMKLAAVGPTEVEDA